MHLVLKDFLKIFTSATTWCKIWPPYFTHSGGRKFRYVQFLKAQNANARIAPTLVMLDGALTLAVLSTTGNLELQFLASEKSVLGPRLPSTFSDLFEILDKKTLSKNQNGIKFSCCSFTKHNYGVGFISI